MELRVFLCLVLGLAAEHAASAPISVPVTKDNSIVLVDGEWTENGGQKGQIRIKANQHLVAMGFDTSGLLGKRLKRATLVCYQAERVISGVTLSTIAAPWDELKSNGLTAGVAGTEGWGYAGARFPAVMGGSSFTLVQNVPSELRDGKYHWDVPPDMIYAMTIGVAQGLGIHEHDGEVSRNPTIFSREQSAKKPVLLVELDDRPDAAPLPPSELKLSAVSGTEARLTLQGPAEGFAYEITVDGVPLGRHNIPLVTADAMQSIPLRDLPNSVTRPGMHDVRVVTLSRTGERSAPVQVKGAIFESAPIAKPSVALPPQSRSPVADLAVIPVTDKYDQAGQPVGDLPADYRTHNLLFDGKQVRLVGAAGEVVGFQVLLRGRGAVSIQVKLDGPPARVDLHQALYVPANGRMIPDPLVSLPAKLALQADADQVVFADIFLPFDSQPGVRKGTITISDGRTLPLEITVLPFAIPKRATFLCEMNGYGLPDHVNDYYAIQQIAYDHRVHANIVHYSHQNAAPGSRKSNTDMRLRSGRRMDNQRYDNIAPGAKGAFWDDFAEAFGPFLDGSLFQDGHRGPIPAPGFYLTFHESWPLNCRAYFNGDRDAYHAFRDQPAYAETYVNVMRDFVRLAQAKGWTQTGFQVYFNNKGSLAERDKAPWVLDEPSSFWDYRALQYFGDLTDQGRATSSERVSSNNLRIDYRIDISRPEFCRGQLDRRADLWVLSSWAFQHYRRVVTDRMERDGLKAWVYGSSNHIHETNRNIQAWAIDAWRDGATGLVPWQTVDKTGKALQQADQLGLFIFDKDANGQTVIRHSARLKAYREAQQLIEYLNLLKERYGWSPDQLRRFVTQYVPLDAEVHKTNEADAGTTAYGRLSAIGLESLKRAAGELLRQKS